MENYQQTTTELSFSSENDSKLDELQKANIGVGLDGSSPISDVTGRLSLNNSMTRINQAIHCIFHTNFKDVPMLPILGSDVNELVFEPNDEILEKQISEYLLSALVKLEPRILVTSLDTVIDENYLRVTLKYVLTNTNIRGEFNDSISYTHGGDIN